MFFIGSVGIGKFFLMRRIIGINRLRYLFLLDLLNGIINLFKIFYD